MAAMGSLQNRRLRLPRFESWTCHHQRKRPMAWDFPDSRAGAFGPMKSRCGHGSPAVSSRARTYSGQDPARSSGPPEPLTPVGASSPGAVTGASASTRSPMRYRAGRNGDLTDGPDLRQLWRRDQVTAREHAGREHWARGTQRRDHPDLRGHQPDPARGDGPAPAEMAGRLAFPLVSG
jgi:hypothetical protein